MAISARARQLRAEGRDVISFGAGEPDFPTPENIIAAATRSAHDPANHRYTSNAGLAPLREAVARNTATYSGVEVDAAEVIVTNGAKQAIYQTFATLIDPGDEVLLPSPYWVTYPAGIELADGVPVPLPTTLESGFKVKVDDLESARTDRTKMLVFVSPSNPTGAVYTAEETKAIGEWAADNDVWVMADEIYQRLVYDGNAPSIAAVTPQLENWVLINGVAKTYAMTGWRVGWMIAPDDIIDAAERLQSHATSNVANISQQAAIAALNGPQETVEEMRQAFDRRRKLMFEMVSDIKGFNCIEPKGAFYLFPEVTEAIEGRYPSSAALVEAILEEALVAVVPGESFGAPGHIRLSYAVGEEDIVRGIERITGLLGG